MDSRRLSAILAADIVGYSSLMENDEARTLDALRDFRTNILAPMVATSSGHIVKNMGDGWLIEFTSAINAVKCAAEIQETLLSNPSIRLRVGIHIGDIVHENEDIFGEGVNIASRLEQLAEPGAVLVSEIVHGLVSKKIDFDFQDLGRRRLKNLSDDQLVFGWAPGAAPDAAAMVQPNLITGTERTAIPLVFINEFRPSGDEGRARDLAEELQYELLLILTRRSGISVVSKCSDDMKPNYILGGRSRVSQGKWRLDATIVSGINEESLWTRRFECDAEESDDLVARATDQISVFLRNQTNAFEGARYSRIADRDLTIGELLTKAGYLIQRWDRQSVEAARAVLETVLSRSPDNAMALAMMASTTLIPLFAGYASVDQSEVSQAITFADRAVGLDANNDFIFQARGMVRCILLKDFAGAASDFKRSLEINPNFLVTRFSLASLSIYSGDAKAAINPLLELLDVSPEDPLIPMVYTLLSAACLLADDDKLALQYARQAHDRAPLMPTCAAIYAAAAAQDREIVGSKAFSSMISRFDLRTTDLEKLPFVRRDDIELFRSRLRIAGARE